MLDNHVLSIGVSEIVYIPTNPEYAYSFNLSFIKQQVLKFHLLTSHFAAYLHPCYHTIKKIKSKQPPLPKRGKKNTDTPMPMLLHGQKFFHPIINSKDIKSILFSKELPELPAAP